MCNYSKGVYIILSLDSTDILSQEDLTAIAQPSPGAIAVSENLPVLEGQLGKPEYLFQVPSGVAAADLHHQRHRGLQPPAAQGDQSQIRISHR